MVSERNELLGTPLMSGESESWRSHIGKGRLVCVVSERKKNTASHLASAVALSKNSSVMYKYYFCNQTQPTLHPMFFTGGKRSRLSVKEHPASRSNGRRPQISSSAKHHMKQNSFISKTMSYLGSSAAQKTAGHTRKCLVSKKVSFLPWMYVHPVYQRSQTRLSSPLRP